MGLVGAEFVLMPTMRSSPGGMKQVPREGASMRNFCSPRGDGKSLR
jgi:hypothetical protein